MSNSQTDNPTTQPGIPSKSITISAESLTSTLLAVLVVALGWGFWGYVQNTINDNPRITEILVTQKEMQKDIQNLREAISRLSAAFEFIDRSTRTSDGRPPSGGGS